jgi:hypothetical protein
MYKLAVFNPIRLLHTLHLLHVHLVIRLGVRAVRCLLLVSAKDFTLPLPLNWRVSQEIARRTRPICCKNAWYGDETSDYVLCVQKGKRRQRFGVRGVVWLLYL